MTDPTNLKTLWQSVFGDEPDYIDRWFRSFYRPERTAVIERDGETAAMAFVLPAGRLDGLPCAHLYAIAVAPAFRGLGLGREVTLRAAEKARACGFPAVMLRPADEALFRFYRRCGFETAFSVCRQEIQLPFAGSPAVPCQPDEYLSVRGPLLRGTFSVEQSEEICRFFSDSGGRLYAGNDFCAAVENLGDTAFFRELISRGAPLSGKLLSSMAEGAVRAVTVSPAGGGESAEPFAMLGGDAGGRLDRWPGLCLD